MGAFLDQGRITHPVFLEKCSQVTSSQLFLLTGAPGSRSELY